MHPNAAFRPDSVLGKDRAPGDEQALLEALIDEIGFGMVFAATPDGPKVAHVPLLYTGEGALQFHLARGNALAPHLEGLTVLAVVNGPDGYVSPRWYADPAQVPTWNYVSVELDGRVRRIDENALIGHLEALTVRQEARLAQGEPWTMAKLPEAKLRQLTAAITGFEIDVLGWRPTFKLSQNKPAAERERVAAGLETQGATGIAAVMRRLVKPEDGA